MLRSVPQLIQKGFFASLLLLGGRSVADSRTQEVAGRLSTSEQQQLRQLNAMQATVLRELDGSTTAEGLRAEIDELFREVPLSLSLRAPGAPGVQDWLKTRLADVEGLTWLGELKELVPVPVLLENTSTLQNRESKATAIEVAGESFDLQPFWPNGALPTLAQEEGLKGKLVYVGNGAWEDVEGLDPRGAIVVMNFKGGRNWNRLFDLGAKAVVVVEDEYVSRPLAERFYANTPLPFPRYVVDRETGAALIQQATRRGDGGNVIEGAEAVVRGGNWYENRMARSMFAWLPPQGPLTLEIQDTDLLGRIAADFGVEVQDVLDENQLTSPEVKAGDVLSIPGREDSYTVKEQDLLKRISREYGIEVEPLLEANMGVDTELPSGTTLVMPALSDPMVLVVRLEGTSSIPGLPHGAQAAVNIVSAVRMLEIAGEMPEGHRRRGLLVAFLEGDVHGGRASRQFLERYLLSNDLLAPALVAVSEGADDQTVYNSYLEVESWLTSQNEVLSENTADWFVNIWLNNKLDQYRVALAESRVAMILDRIEAQSETEKAALLQKQKALEDQIERVIAFRKATFENREFTEEQKAKAFLDQVDGELVAIEDVVALTREKLEQDFFREVEEERLDRQLKEQNRETVSTVLETIYPPSRPMDLDAPLLGWHLDLSTGSPHLQIAPSADIRGLSPIKSQILFGKVERMDRVQAFAALEAGWEESWSFIGNNVQAVFPLQQITPAPSYAELWAKTGVGILALRAANDTRVEVDTPLDVPENLDYENLARLLRTTQLLFRVSLESALDGNLAAQFKDENVSRLMGMTTKFNVRSGIDAKDPVAATLVYDPSLPKKLDVESYNTATYMGNRMGVMTLSRINGRYALPVELLSLNATKSVHAYKPDEQSGLFEFVFDAGQIGTQKQSNSYKFIPKQDTYKNLIVYELYPLVISFGVDPLSYAVPRTPGDLPAIQDAILNGTPRHVNMEHPFVHFQETELSGLVVYMEKGRFLQMVYKKQGQVRALLLGTLSDDPENLEGEGIEIGPKDGERNLILPLAPVAVARSMQEINERRLAIYERYGIRNRELSESLVLSRKKLDATETYLENKQWQKAIGSAREAWGILAKGYPAMLKLGREAVLSVVILMALLAPTAVFLEKLILGGKHILARLGGSVGIFVLGTVFLNFFHPAFKIAASPFIVVIAFAMILMAIAVLGICYQRFEVLVRRARIEGGEAESEEISFVSTLSTAFSLGVSNLKKRPTRTLLTAFTVTVLTFSIVSFVSVSGKDTLFLRPIPLDLKVKSVEVSEDEIVPPRYEGALFRDFSWSGLSADFINAVETEFGSQFTMARRMHYIEVAGGNNAALEGRNQIEIRYKDRSEIVTALMGYEPIERELTGFNQAVSNQSWFREETADSLEDRFHIIIPDRVAKELGIEASMLVDEQGNRLPDEQLPEVLMMSSTWRVIGILDADKADRLRDVNAKSLALVDYLRSAITPSTGTGRLETEDDLLHMNWEDLAVVPVAARGAVDGIWNSLALKFPKDFDFEAFRDELARRMDRAMFAYVDGEVNLMSARKESSVGGLAKVMVPIILCILIVSNTMMGTVDERVGEVQMLGAIGLSPSQISFLLLSESTVFSCIGIIFGTFSGLVFAQLVGFFPDTLGQLSFNFTSLASTFLAMGTGGIVLIATLIPARKAAALAAPSGMEKWELPEPEGEGTIRFELPFTLTRGNAMGMSAFFRRFLINHVDSSSADFITKGASMANNSSDDREGLLIRCHMWLAPYDLDVAQDLNLEIEPSDTEGVYGVTILLHRTSGTQDAWIRTNYGFLNLVRKQFLLWRNLDPELRKRYVNEGAALLVEDQPA
jgi:LysM repeat protein